MPPGPLPANPPIWELLAPQRSTHVVDIGANPIDGVPPYLPLLRTGHCRVVGFEPQPEALQKLNAQKSTQETYLPYAVGDGQEHTLYICQASGMTSLLEPNPPVLKAFHGFSDWGAVKERVPLKTQRLDDIAEVGDIDYLKIDVQGSELSIFRGGRQKLAEAVAIQTEVSFIPLYKQQPHFGEIDAELHSLGFVFHTFADVRCRALAPMLVNKDPYRGINQLVEADAVYVKDFTALSKLPTDKVEQLALIAHECYRSWDLTNLCLLELERRGGKALQPAYLAALARTTSSM